MLEAVCVCDHDRVYDGFEWGERNRNGEKVLGFRDGFDIRVGYTFFKKDSEKLIAYKSGDPETVVDSVIEPKEVIKNVRNVKANPRKKCFLQHKLVIMDLTFEDILLISAI